VDAYGQMGIQKVRGSNPLGSTLGSTKFPNTKSSTSRRAAGREPRFSPVRSTTSAMFAIHCLTLSGMRAKQSPPEMLLITDRVRGEPTKGIVEFPHPEPLRCSILLSRERASTPITEVPPPWLPGALP
jgi:hypothetical protein